jgi:signal transduction histidine kinase
MQVKTATITENRPKKLEVLDRNGKKRWIEARVIPVLQKGKNNKIILIIDESEKWAANNTVALLQKNAVLGEIISEFAHDVRNIINRLTTGLQLLAKRMELNDEGLLSIQELKGECANMTELMDSVLSYSKQNFENFQQINIYELINQNIYKLQKKAKTNNVSLILNSDNPDCKIIADPRSIERVITNLINNGIEAIGAYGGAVSISLSSNEGHPGYLCVQIADTGPGIPPEIEGKLFQKFSTGKVEGTGLGLFITQKIIEFHRGWIDFDTFPGGTIFNIYLPNEQLGEHL